MQDNFHLDLFRSKAALLKGMLLVDELDCDDGLGRIGGNGFANGGICALTDRFADQAEGKVCGERSNLALWYCQLNSLWTIARAATGVRSAHRMTYPRRRGRHDAVDCGVCVLRCGVRRQYR
jgi:hypothetical protein